MNKQVIGVLVSRHKMSREASVIYIWLKELAYKESQSSTYVTSFLKY